MQLRAIVLTSFFSFLLIPPDTATTEITVTEGTNIAAVASPDRKWIAMDLQGGLWILPIQGGEAKRITPLTLEARQPMWSPDSQALAFQGYDDNAWHIYTIRADGGGATAVTDGWFDDREPDWSPDGTRVVFSSDRFGGIYTIWTVDLRTRSVSQLSKAVGTTPCWASSRDVLFEGVQDRAGKKVTSWWSAAPGRTDRLIGADTPAADAQSRLRCANGRTLALGRQIESTSGEDVFPFLPQWISPTEILYTADGHIKRREGATGPAATIPFSAKLEIRRPDYVRKHRELLPEGGQRLMGIVDPAVSPDGSTVAFTALGDLWVVEPKTKAVKVSDDVYAGGGGGLTRLTNDPFVELDPAWSPDGKTLAFSSDRGGSMELWTVDLATRRFTQLTRENAMVTGAAWSPTGSRIAYVVDRRLVKTIDLQRPADAPRSHGSSLAMDSGRPTWGPDGRVFATGQMFHYSDRYREGTNQLVLHSIDSERPIGSATLVAHHSAGNRENNGPVWSPDGSRMAFVSEGRLVVMAVGANAGPLDQGTVLTSDSPDSPSWARDSRHIVYLTPDGLRKISVDGGEPERVPIDMGWARALPPERTVIHAGHLFDGRNETLQSAIDIVVEEGRIRDVKPHDPALHAGSVVDASDETVIPGLIEMHAHLEPAYGDALGRIWLSYGVTTVRNPAGNPYWNHELREAFDSGKRAGPRVFNAGDPFDGTRIYYAGGVSIGESSTLERELDRATRLRYDFFKTYVRLPDRYQRRVIDYAHEHGLAVTSHEIYPAAAFGVDGVEHIRGTSRRGYSPKVTAKNSSYADVIAIISRSGMTLTPTIGIQGGFAYEAARDPSMMKDPRLDLFPKSAMGGYRARFGTPAAPDDLAKADTSLNGLRKTVAAIVASGGKIIAGTDSPIIPYGLGLHSELLHFVEAGMSPFRALQTATVNAADALGLADELGSIEPGKLADLVFVRGNPLEDARAARDVRRVMREGRLYTIDELLARR